MKRGNILYLIFIALILCIIGCTTPPPQSIPQEEMPIEMLDLDRLSDDEKEEVISLLKMYIIQLQANLSSDSLIFPEGDEIHRKHRKMQGLPNIAFPLRVRDAVLDEPVAQKILNELKEKYQFAGDNIYSAHYLVEPEEFAQFCDKADIWQGDAMSSSVHNKYEEVIETTCASMPSYFHYMQKDGKEKRITLLTRQDYEVYKGTYMIITPELQPDGKTIKVDYLVRTTYPREGVEYLIDGKQVSIIKQDAILRFRWEGQASIPQGKGLVIECRPYKKNLPDSELRRRFFVFIVYGPAITK